MNLIFNYAMVGLIIALLIYFIFQQIRYFDFNLGNKHNWIKASITNGNVKNKLVSAYFQIFILFLFFEVIHIVTNNSCIFGENIYVLITFLLLVFLILRTRSLQRDEYPEFSSFSKGSLRKIIVLKLDSFLNLLFQVNPVIKWQIDFLSEWTGSYWRGICIPETVIQKRELLVLLPIKYADTRKNRKILENIQIYCRAKNVQVSIASLVSFENR